MSNNEKDTSFMGIDSQKLAELLRRYTNVVLLTERISGLLDVFQSTYRELVAKGKGDDEITKGVAAMHDGTTLVYNALVMVISGECDEEAALSEAYGKMKEKATAVLDGAVVNTVPPKDGNN